MMYFTRIPHWLQRLYPSFTWRLETQKPYLHLTFDDGPTPEITPWVLDQLDQYRAQATFFLIGQRVEQFPELVHEIIDRGHTIGNHSQHHRNGWRTNNRTYLRDVLKGQQTIAEFTGKVSVLYRPPYGRISHGQARQVLRTHEIVMMDVVSGDFDLQIDGEKCSENVIQAARPGSIVVFHDSEKAWERLQVALPKVLKHFHQAGYQFISLHSQAELQNS